jgi:hypothetical protein
VDLMVDRIMSPFSGRQFRKNGDVVFTEDLGDKAGRNALNGMFGEAMISNRIDFIAIQFQYNIAPMDVSVIMENGGTVIQEDAQAVLDSGVGVNGLASFESVRAMRYIPGHDGMCYFTAEFVEGSEGSYNRVGIFGSENGYYLGFEGSEFCVSIRNDEVDLHFFQSEFNLDKLDGSGESGYVLNKEFLNIYRISYGWLGIAPIVFEVYGGFRLGWIPFHVIDFTNSKNGVHSENPVLPLRAEVFNNDNEENVTLKIGSMNAGILFSGQDDSVNRYFSFGNEKEVGTSFTNIFTFRNKETFFGKVNRIVIKFQLLSILTDGSQSVQVQLRRGAVVGGVPVFNDLDSDNSVIEVDVAGTTVTGGVVEVSVGAPPIGGVNINLTEIVVELFPGETMTVAARTRGGNNLVRVDARHEGGF